MGLEPFGGVLSGAAAFGLAFLGCTLRHKLKRVFFTATDVAKSPPVKIPRSGFPIILGILGAGIILYLVTNESWIIPIILTGLIAYVIGHMDDARPRAGWFKPILLIIAVLPLAYIGWPSIDLLYEDWRIPGVLSAILGILVIPVFGNTVNSFDTHNGVISKYMTYAFLALAAVLLVRGDASAYMLAVGLAATCAAFHRYHHYPAKLFPGDGGALCLGATYGAFILVADLAVIGTIALIPMIFNSFLYLTRGGFKEHRQLPPAAKYDDQMRLHRNTEPGAPRTLITMLVRNTPLTERQIIRRLTILYVISCIAAAALGIALEI